MKNRLTQAQKEFQEAKAGSDSIAKVSLINMIKEDLAKAENTLEFQKKQLAGLQKK